MTVTITPEISKIAASLGLSEQELFSQALVTLLQEKKRQTLQLQLEFLARYGADSIADLETKITEGRVTEHPAWEDLIVVENLTTRLDELNAYLDGLQNAG